MHFIMMHNKAVEKNFKGLKVKCHLCRTEKAAFATEVSAELWVCQVCTSNQREEPIDETGTSAHSGAVPVEVRWHLSSDSMMHPAETNYVCRGARRDP
jgi:hypothetical protein